MIIKCMFNNITKRFTWPLQFCMQIESNDKGNPEHIAPACVGSDHFGSNVRNISLHFYKSLFPGLEPMTSHVSRLLWMPSLASNFSAGQSRQQHRCHKS
jgi:hypothetical protein